MSNSGTIDVLTNLGSITGGNGGAGNGAAGGSGGSGLNNTGTIGTLTNAGMISSGAGGAASGAGVAGIGRTGLINNSTIGTVSNTGTIVGGAGGLGNYGLIDVLSNSGTIAGTEGSALYNQNALTSIGTLNNLGLIMGGYAGIGNGATIGTLVNGGTISGSSTGIANAGTIGVLTSSGTISGSLSAGIVNTSAGSIGTLSNSGAISGGQTGIISYNGTIGTLSNSGTISGGTLGVVNFGMIGTLPNTGRISGGNTGIANGGMIGGLTNSGTIAGGQVGFANAARTSSGSVQAGTIGTLSNSGIISGGKTGIANSGTMGPLTNTGTISGGAYALYSTGTLGTVTNTGLINGNIYVAGQNLSIIGGSGSSFGTLAGGTVNIANGNLSLLSSNIRLASNIVVNGGQGTVSNAANLLLSTPQTITGNYSQGAAGSLILTAASAAGGKLVVNGVAAMKDATVVFDAVNGYRPRPGSTYTLVSATGPSSTFSTDHVVVNIPGYSGKILTEVLNPGPDPDLVLEFPQTNPPTIYADVLTSQRLMFLGGLSAVANQLDTLRGAPSDGKTGTAAVTADTTAWVSGTGQFVHTSSANGIDGYSGSAGGVVAGLDHAFTPDLRLGMALSSSWGSLNGGGGSSYTGQSIQVQAYGTAQKGIAFVDAQVAGQFGEGTVHRDFSDGAAVGNNLTSTAVGAAVRGGVRYDLAGWGIQPSVTLGTVSISQGSVTETGQSASAMQISSGQFNTSYLLSGVELDRRFALNGSLDLVVTGRAGWMYQMGQTTAQMDAVAQGSSLAFGSAPVGRNAADLGVGVILDTHSPLRIYARYGTMLFAGSTSQQVDGGLVYSW